MPFNRNERLAADYQEMLKIRDRPYLSWIVTKGEPPYAEEYLLTIRLRMYVLSQQSGKYIVGVRDQCTVRVTLWDSYPHIAPNIRMLSIPPVFHPDWYSKGTYCSSETWRSDDSLKNYVLRMIKTLMYDPYAMATETPANYKALEWYLKNRERSDLFPSDTSVLSENRDDETAVIDKALSSFDEVVDSWDIR